MNVLVLGGTVFVGRHLVDAALAGGHDITLFTRGLTNPDLFPEVEHLRGDRTSDLHALAGRKWDAVFDTTGFDPDVVRRSGALLAGNVGFYAFTSTISVYRHYGAPNLDETSPVAAARRRRAHHAAGHRSVRPAEGTLRGDRVGAVPEQPGRTVRPDRRTARQRRAVHVLAAARRARWRSARARRTRARDPGDRRPRPRQVDGDHGRTRRRWRVQRDRVRRPPSARCSTSRNG